jgi:hypothetical protein
VWTWISWFVGIANLLRLPKLLRTNTLHNMTLASRLSMTRYELLLRCSGDFDWPDFAGNALRGAFGAALRELSCLTGASTCAACSITAQCPYPEWIEPQATRAGLLPLGATIPSPWVIEPPEEEKKCYRSQEEFSFSFVVFGRAHKDLSLCLLAFRRALFRGIGRKRVPFEIVGVRQSGQTSWTALAQFVPLPPVVPVVPPAPKSVRLRFATPVSIVRCGRTLEPQMLQFQDVFSALQRRLGLLESCYGESPSVWDYRARVLEAESCTWRGKNLQGVDLSRYSHRQGRTMHWRGVTGEFLVESLPDTLWPVLYLGQWSHIGKHASFGLGKYRIDSACKFADPAA